MVLTRRAAREAEAAAAREAESSPIPTPDAEKFDEEEIPHIVSRNTFTTDQQNEPATIEDVLDVDVGAEGPVIADNHSKEEVLEDEDEDEDEDENDVDAPLVADTKIIDQGMRRAGLQPTDHSGPAVNHNAPNYKNKRPSRRVNLYLQLGTLKRPPLRDSMWDLMSPSPASALRSY